MKKSLIIVFVAALLGLLTGNCSNDKGPSGTSDTLDVVALKQIIQAKNDQFTNAHITGDTAFLSHIFTADARIFAPGSEVVTGRRSIKAINREYIGYQIKEFREVTTALYGSGPYLVDEGTYLMRYGKDNTTEKGKYLNVWKYENGDWKLNANIWNTSTPQ